MPRIDESDSALVIHTLEVDSSGAAIGDNNPKAVSYPLDVFTFTPTLDTNPFAQHDLLFDVVEIEDFFRSEGGVALIESVVVTDKDDNGLALDLCFYNATVDMGTVNSAVSISDADEAKGIGDVEILADDYTDKVNSQKATLSRIGLPVKAASGSRSLFVGAVLRDAAGGTYTASGLQIAIGRS